MRSEAVSSTISGVRTVYKMFNLDFGEPLALKSLLKG